MGNENEETDAQKQARTNTPRQLDFAVVEVDANGGMVLFGKQPPAQITFAELEQWMALNVIKDKAIIRTYIKHREVVVHKEVVTTTTFKPLKKK
jgi:hypothetical protein